MLDELSGEAFDMLASVWDFLEFKDIMLSYKKSKSSAAPVAAPPAVSGSSARELDLSIGGTGLSISGAGLSVAGRRV